MPARSAANFADDFLRLDHSFGDLIGARFRLEGCTIRRTHYKRQRVPHFARHWFSDICLLYDILFSANIDTHFLLENLPGKLSVFAKQSKVWRPIFQSVVPERFSGALGESQWMI